PHATPESYTLSLHDALPILFTHTGMVIVVNQRDRAGLEANVKLQRELEIDVRTISANDLAKLDPHAKLAEDELAVFEAEAGYVEAVQVVASFADSARRYGSDIREGVEVQSIVHEGGRIAGVETNQGRFDCKTLILATGPWAARLGA